MSDNDELEKALSSVEDYSYSPVLEEIQQKLILSALETGRKTTDQLKRIVDWGIDAHINNSILNLVLNDKVDIDIQEDGELTFREKKK